MTKPSTWTPEEAWYASFHTHASAFNLPITAKALPFPADPVERVSDEALKDWSHYKPMRAVQSMALELIERRARDKEQKG